MFYVYILKSKKTSQLYVGYTEDLRERFKQHNLGQSKSTKPFIPWELVYYEAYKSKKDALERERKLKGFKNGYAMLKRRISDSLI